AEVDHDDRLLPRPARRGRLGPQAEQVGQAQSAQGQGPEAQEAAARDTSATGGRLVDRQHGTLPGEGQEGSRTATTPASVPAARVRSSGPHRICDTPRSNPWVSRAFAPRAAFQSRTVPSSLEEASSGPFFWNATAVSGPPWPSSMYGSRPS